MTVPLMQKAIMLQDTFCNLECMVAREYYKGTEDLVKFAKREMNEIINFLLKMEEIATGNSKAGIEFLENKRLLEKYAEVWLPKLRVGDLNTDTEYKGETSWSDNRKNLTTVKNFN